MSQQAIPIYGPRGGTARGYLGWSGANNNALHQAATQGSDRKTVSPLDYDVHRTVTNFGRRTMMTLGRWVYANFPPLRGAVDEQAEFASSTFFPQYFGANKAWGMAAEALLESHDGICDVAGPPYNARLWRRNLIISCLRDGDMLTVLVKTPTGYPLLQCIPGHRIGSQPGETIVVGGEFDGARLIDGVIVNDYNAALAYRVNISDQSNNFASGNCIEIPARDCFLSFDPVYVGQLRGFSPVGASAFYHLDIQETDGFERIAQKLAASIGLIEKNPLGEADAGNLSADGQRANTSTGAAAILAKETVTDSGVTVRYFQSSDPNAGLDAYRLDRPTQAQQQFRATMMRDAFAGIGWSVDYSLDPTKIGGAPDRVLVDKLNRTLQARQDLLLRPACVRWDGYRTSCFIQRGDLSKDVDWFKWTHQGPARLSADRRYDSDVDLQEIEMGLKTRRRGCAERGDYIDDVTAEKTADAAAKWAAAKELSGKFGITIQEAYNSIWARQPQGITPGAGAAANDRATNSEGQP